MEKRQKLDRVIEPIISLLNRKGYKTTASCTGHPYHKFKKLRDELYLWGKKKDPKFKRRDVEGEIYEGYIAFEKKESPKVIKQMLKGTRMYRKLTVTTDRLQRVLDFHSKGMKQKDIDAYWREVYGVIKKRL